MTAAGMVRYMMVYDAMGRLARLYYLEGRYLLVD